jgi:DNA-binding CsgD family transcriptional regulator
VPSLEAPPALDDAEWAVLEIVARAHSNSDITERLSMSAAGVRTLKDGAMQKAGLGSRGHIVEFVRSHGRYATRTHARVCSRRIVPGHQTQSAEKVPAVIS